MTSLQAGHCIANDIQSIKTKRKSITHIEREGGDNYVCTSETTKLMTFYVQQPLHVKADRKSTLHERGNANRHTSIQPWSTTSKK